MRSQTITGIFLIQESKILLLQKKNIHWWFVWTIPFTKVPVSYMPSEYLVKFLQENLNIQITAENFIKKLLVSKVNTEKTILTTGFFPSCIQREWKVRINHDIYNWYKWFDKDQLPDEITEDLQKIIKAFADGKNFLEIK